MPMSPALLSRQDDEIVVRKNQFAFTSITNKSRKSLSGRKFARSKNKSKTTPSTK
jgi:hypothetical protein